MTDRIDRRNFLKRAAGAAGALGLAGLSGPLAAQAAPMIQRARGANDTIRVSVWGVNGRGTPLVGMFQGVEGVDVINICDVDRRVLQKGVNAVTKAGGREPSTETDFRRVLENKDVDAVVIATPDHLHAYQAVAALQAGKHVYLEKPISQNPREGELVIEAVERYGKVFQLGNQRRSYPNTNRAIEAIRGGEIGRAYFARGWYCNNRAPIGVGKEVAPPAELDYELWQGPAPRRPYKDNLIHYNWHWFWHWGTGEALNNGTHEIDVARWALGVDFPSRVVSNGGRYHYQDDWECPDTQVIGWDFEDGKSISWEGRSCNGWQTEQLGRGVLVFGTEGTMLIDGNAFTVYDNKRNVIREVKGAQEGDPLDTRSTSRIDELHVIDFIEAVRGNKQPNSPATEGHKSCAILHIGNIAQRTGRTLNLNPANGHIVGDDEAMSMWSREYAPGWELKV